jgi:phosphohistidine phosphatase
MRRLFLLRHAKAQAHGAVHDFDRALISRGKQDSARLGQWMAAQGFLPQCALVSPAIRTRETFTSVAEHLHPAPQLILAPRLYNAEAQTIIDEIGGIDDACTDLLLVGHNPAISETADLLTGHGDNALRTILAMGMPTAALAIISFDQAHWHELSTNMNTGTLTHFITGARLSEREHNL